MERQRKKFIIGVGVVFLVTFLVWYTKGEEGFIAEEGHLLRPQKGEGEYDAELILEIDGKEEVEWTVTVPEQHLTTFQEEQYLSYAIEEIQQTFPGENNSLDAIRGSVDVRTSYQEGRVLAEWKFDNSGLITEDGFIEETVIVGETEEVSATVYLTCEDSSLIYEFYFTICKQGRGKEEVFYEKIKQQIFESCEAEGTEYLQLPTYLEGHELVWKDKKSYLPLQVFSLGMVIVALLPAIEKEREKEAREKRKAQLMREYPDMVNKLALLLGAGMTLQGAWRQITRKYSDEKQRKLVATSIVYEEMLITQRDMDSGKGEARAYQAFGERCELQRYRKLSRYLIQNLKKGNKSLCEWLEQEASEAFAERKSMAQQLGEEVGTKLLFPMLLMLGIVIVIIIIPAVISFQSGVN